MCCTFIIPSFLKIPLSPVTESCSSCCLAVPGFAFLGSPSRRDSPARVPARGPSGASSARPGLAVCSACGCGGRPAALPLSRGASGGCSLAVADGPLGGALTGPRDARLVPFLRGPPLTPAGHGVRACVASGHLPSDRDTEHVLSPLKKCLSHNL